MSRKIYLVVVPLLWGWMGVAGCSSAGGSGYPGDEVREFNRETRGNDVQWAERRSHYPKQPFELRPPKWKDAELRAFLQETRARDVRWADESRRVRLEREQEDRWWGKRLTTLYGYRDFRDIDVLMDSLYGPITPWTSSYSDDAAAKHAKWSRQ